jgi:hypothetical protein
MWTAFHSLCKGLWKPWTALWATRPVRLPDTG